MANTELYTSEYIDFTKEPMFFGKGKNTQRFDILKIKFFDERNAKMQGFDWAFDEAKLTLDYIDFNTNMKPNEQFIMTRDLQRLIFFDSLQGRGILLTLGQICTLPELENAMLTWQYFEGAKHSKTYTENLKGVYVDPKTIFDESFTIPEITKMADKIKQPYEDAYKKIIEYVYYEIFELEYPEEKFKELKRATLRLIVAINILEGVRFYPGFACIWALNKSQGYVEGTSKNLKFIARDENIHLSITQKMLQILKNNEDEGFTEIFEEMEEEIWQMYVDAFDEESEWIDYLFSQGSILGLNAEIAKEYLKYIINRRLKAIGYNIMFQNCSTNPIPWIESYINMDIEEGLPQEGEVTNYISGGVDNSKEASLDLYKKMLV
jgi:ribonucleoside-diphosphate reductase beta chain